MAQALAAAIVDLRAKPFKTTAPYLTDDAKTARSYILHVCILLVWVKSTTSVCTKPGGGTVFYESNLPVKKHGAFLWILSLVFAEMRRLFLEFYALQALCKERPNP